MTSITGAAPRGGTAADPLEGRFGTIQRLLYETAGIALNDAKRELVHSRLTRRIRRLGGGSISEYVDFVQTEEGRSELTEMVDILTTNKTSFFRESPHFDLLRRIARDRGPSARGMTVWSAGCSSGEEAYTLAMVLADCPSSDPARILATDISERVLERARAAIYGEDQVGPVPAEARQRHLKRGPEPGTWVVSDELRSMVRLGRLNLMGPWPMRGPFDAIFCRNVMIYFDTPTRQSLVQRFETLLPPGGFLFVGHSESLTALDHGLTYVQPAVYRRAV